MRAAPADSNKQVSSICISISIHVHLLISLSLSIFLSGRGDGRLFGAPPARLGLRLLQAAAGRGAAARRAVRGGDGHLPQDARGGLALAGGARGAGEGREAA